MSFKRMFSQKNEDFQIDVDSTDDIEVLKEIALNNPDYRIRLKAVFRISDDEFLKGIVENDPEPQG